MQRRQQVDAGEARPVTVRLEQLIGLRRFDGATAKCRAELHQAEVACQAALAPAEPFEADHAYRPRAESTLAPEALGDGCGRNRVQALEVETSAEPDERRTTAGVQAELSQLGG